MSKINLWKASVTLFMLAPMVTFAGSGGLFGGSTAEGDDLFIGLTNFINDLLIPLIIAVAVLVFVYGVFTYFIAGGADEEKRAQGRNLMLYSILGFVAIVGLWAIVNYGVELFFGTDTGTAPDLPKAKVPGP